MNTEQSQQHVTPTIPSTKYYKFSSTVGSFAKWELV